MRFMWYLEYLDYSGHHKIWTLSSLFYTMFYTGVLHNNNKKHTVAEHSIKLLLEIMYCMCNLQIKVSKQLTR